MSADHKRFILCSDFITLIGVIEDRGRGAGAGAKQWWVDWSRGGAFSGHPLRGCVQLHTAMDRGESYPDMDLF